MNFNYIDFFFINLLAILSSIALFLGTIRFGDHILAFFQKR